ncbi:hypothetical protein JCM3766R1_001384 [Sporobolomyces carnicolor]
MRDPDNTQQGVAPDSTTPQRKQGVATTSRDQVAQPPSAAGDSLDNIYDDLMREDSTHPDNTKPHRKLNCSPTRSGTSETERGSTPAKSSARPIPQRDDTHEKASVIAKELEQVRAEYHNQSQTTYHAVPPTSATFASSSSALASRPQDPDPNRMFVYRFPLPTAHLVPAMIGFRGSAVRSIRNAVNVEVVYLERDIVRHIPSLFGVVTPNRAEHLGIYQGTVSTIRLALELAKQSLSDRHYFAPDELRKNPHCFGFLDFDTTFLAPITPMNSVNSLKRELQITRPSEATVL